MELNANILIVMALLAAHIVMIKTWTGSLLKGIVLSFPMIWLIPWVFQFGIPIIFNFSGK